MLLCVKYEDLESKLAHLNFFSRPIWAGGGWGGECERGSWTIQLHVGKQQHIGSGSIEGQLSVIGLSRYEEL